jgi:hypothetical protein
MGEGIFAANCGRMPVYDFPGMSKRGWNSARCRPARHHGS